MTAVIVNEGVLEGEAVEPTGRPGVPGELLRLRRQAALRRMLLDDDRLLVPLERVDDTVAVQWLHGVHGDERYRLALLLQRIGDRRRHLGDDTVGEDAHVGAAAKIADLAELPGFRA